MTKTRTHAWGPVWENTHGYTHTLQVPILTAAVSDAIALGCEISCVTKQKKGQSHFLFTSPAAVRAQSDASYRHGRAPDVKRSPSARLKAVSPSPVYLGCLSLFSVFASSTTGGFPTRALLWRHDGGQRAPDTPPFPSPLPAKARSWQPLVIAELKVSLNYSRCPLITYIKMLNYFISYYILIFTTVKRLICTLNCTPGTNKVD